MQARGRSHNLSFRPGPGSFLIFKNCMELNPKEIEDTAKTLHHQGKNVQGQEQGNYTAFQEKKL